MKHIPQIPGYQLLNRLGGGLLTTVYTARELATDSLCAVKILRPDWADRGTAMKLLQREARAGLLVHHPHLVPIRLAHVLREPIFLVMDLLPGESLRQHLRRHYQCAVSDAVWIGRQIAEAMNALHRKGFVHGDIKPDNIHLSEEGKAVLLDLGFAHRPGENTAILEKGYILGTVDYLAPELCSATPSEGIHSDLFALGVTLFEMLTGHFPYPRGTVPQTIRRHECDPPANIRQFHDKLPESLSRLIDRLLARRPEDRPKLPIVIQHLVDLEISMMADTRAA